MNTWERHTAVAVADVDIVVQRAFEVFDQTGAVPAALRTPAELYVRSVLATGKPYNQGELDAIVLAYGKLID